VDLENQVRGLFKNLGLVIGRAEEQRNALLTILSGKEQEPGATYFNVFASTITKMNEPLFRPINFEADVSACTGRFSVDGIVNSSYWPLPMNSRYGSLRLLDRYCSTHPDKTLSWV
jgi:hypothetical protein